MKIAKIITVIMLIFGNAPIYSQSWETIKCELQSGDTTFLINERIILSYKDETTGENQRYTERRAVYIDSNKDSEYYDKIFDFRENDGYIEYLDEKKKSLPENLPKKWIPLYQYNNEYYLYAPCQWIISKYNITDTVILYYGWMEGIYGLRYDTIIQKSNDWFTIQEVKRFHYNTEINIYIIDREKGIAVFEYNDKLYEPFLVVSAETARQFPIIVYMCDSLEPEYEFSKPNFDELTAKFKK
ncbi:MAG: hypothetical protein LBT56_05055 [Prevotellaceae bacterium]|jgi:hypothetical protein|nr:hypothetical protein [Prevotellaceae bacterium]